jgi:hypothetical protein
MIKLSVLIYIALCLPDIAYAKCSHPPIPWGYGRSITTAWHITDGSICVTTSSFPEHIARIDIVSKPKHGIAGKSGPLAVAYKPNPGFKGGDAFSYDVTSNSNWKRGAGWVAHVTVFVISK